MKTNQKTTVTFEVNGNKKSVQIDTIKGDSFERDCYRAYITLIWSDIIPLYDHDGFLKVHPELFEEVAMNADYYSTFYCEDNKTAVSHAIYDVECRIE